MNRKDLDLRQCRSLERSIGPVLNGPSRLGGQCKHSARYDGATREPAHVADMPVGAVKVCPHALGRRGWAASCAGETLSSGPYPAGPLLSTFPCLLASFIGSAPADANAAGGLEPAFSSNAANALEIMPRNAANSFPEKSRNAKRSIRSTSTSHLRSKRVPAAVKRMCRMRRWQGDSLRAISVFASSAAMTSFMDCGVISNLRAKSAVDDLLLCPARQAYSYSHPPRGLRLNPRLRCTLARNSRRAIVSASSPGPSRRRLV
jgi:hypothetical protein